MLSSKALWVNILVVVAIAILVLSGRMPVSDVTAIAVAALNAIIAAIKKTSDIEVTQKLVSLAAKNEELVKMCVKASDERENARALLREKGVIHG